MTCTICRRSTDACLRYADGYFGLEVLAIAIVVCRECRTHWRLREFARAVREADARLEAMLEEWREAK